MSADQASQWRTAPGFMLAALGAAVGLGNIWRFSYVAGENGGGAFVLAYLVCVLAIGVPLLIAELAIGRASHTDPVTAFARISPGRPWRWAGWPGIAACIAILGYYPVVAGWVANYLWHVAAHGVDPPGTVDHAARLAAMLADPAQALLWPAVVIAAGAVVVALGIAGGIERASAILMPLFFLLLVGLALHGLTLDGAARALGFLFRPDWAALARPRTWLAAVGQAFFSIGLAMGILVTYGGYLPRAQRLPAPALVIAFGDTAVSLVAGLMVFPAVFTYGFDPAQGTTLVFTVLPEVFAAMPAGRLVAAAFFLLLVIAALTSLVSLIEVPVALLVARLRWRRPAAALAVAVGALVFALPSALGFGVLAPHLPGEAPFLDRLDHLASDILLPLSGIAIALVAGWRWRRAEALAEAGLTGASGWLWLWSLRALLPVAIAAAMARGLGLL
ncbi:sodium-dependent transporter [Elioraea tepidiphila]|jgi:NSS family neurotransmitter:Na+ symporter|uniref:sodium-dependent transporter n=1 Tax=Elioraea tepidiphila TaxID=457934 RepID=UPI002FD8BD7A